MQLFRAGLYWAIVATVTAQSPGPSWPGCAKTSQGYHPGWEVIYLDVKQSAEQPAAFLFSLRNSADGSVTSCNLNKTIPTLGGSLVFTENDGRCFTTWTDDAQVAAEAPPIAFVLDGSDWYWYVEQEWSCDDDEDRLQYTGTALKRVPVHCELDQECRGPDEQGPCIITGQSCSIQYGPDRAPVFVGPAKVTGHVEGSDGPDTSYTTPVKEENCNANFPGFQIVEFTYLPTTNRTGQNTTYPVSYLYLEYKNLADESITECFFETFDLAQSQSGISFTNNWAPRDSSNVGCRTGRNVIVTEADGWTPDGWEQAGSQFGQTWEWSPIPAANVAFNTENYELSLEQFWACGDIYQAFYGTAIVRLNLDCEETFDLETPTECKPSNALYNSNAGPYIITGTVNDVRPPGKKRCVDKKA